MSEPRSRVLLVEDETMVAQLIEAMLDELDCDVVGPAASVPQALKLLETEQADCALLDVNVAGAWVYPVADALRVKGRPFAYLTGYGTAGVREQDGDVPVLQKPFMQDELEQVVDDLLGR